jgi:hypothetical protein
MPEICVRWCNAGFDAAGWRALARSPRDNRGFTEIGRYWFELPGPGWQFLVDDEPLPLVDRAACRSEWLPGFYAGEVTGELRDPQGRRHSLFLLDVAPEPTKIGRETFARMVDELWAADPLLVLGDEPATRPTGHLGDLEDPWVAFARLRRHAPEFLHALRAIVDQPRRTLRSRRDSAPLHHVRRLDRRTLDTAVRSQAVALFAEPEGLAPADIRSRLDVPTIEETLDSAANRAVRAVIEALRLRARSLLVRLQDMVSREELSETRTALAARWPARRQVLDVLVERLTRALRRPPFSETSRAEVTAAGLTAVAADPAYAQAWRQGWRALRQGVSTRPSDERLWISPTWELYERWCFLRIGQLLELHHPEWGWRRQPGRRSWIGCHAGASARLELQPTFSSSAATVPGRWSVSRQRIPDLLLSVDRDGTTRFVVMDAKYRTSRVAVLDAMASAHIYQDSLRIGACRPDASLLLVPSAGGAAWLEDEGAQERHRVGVVPLAPEGSCALPSLLLALLVPPVGG